MNLIRLLPYKYNKSFSYIGGYSENQAEQQRSKKSADDRCPLVGREVDFVQLHSSKQQHSQC